VPTKVEKDIVSGQDTTGHEWDGLKELNTPLPKWWIYTFAATVVWAAVWCLLYPSIPSFSGHFHGLLGYTQRSAVTAEVKALATQRAAYMDKIAATPIAAVRDDPRLEEMALTAGRIAFANNCQPCHGAGGAGQVGYPSLADDVWLWGGKLTDIEQTITHGVRSGDPDARTSQMPKFAGADGVLKPDEVNVVADYVMTLFGGGTPGVDVSKGKAVFAENCMRCHGDAGQGNREFGGPPLKAAIHLHGDTRAMVLEQLNNPRMGVMPNWNARLDPATIRSLALYVHSLGGGE
jgi:cytochrome c oxidase cbb3-type subunit 3